VINLAGLATAVLKLLDEQESARRARVKESLKSCFLRSWPEIPAGTGEVGDR